MPPLTYQAPVRSSLCRSDLCDMERNLDDHAVGNICCVGPREIEGLIFSQDYSNSDIYRGAY